MKDVGRWFMKMVSVGIEVRGRKFGDETCI